VTILPLVLREKGKKKGKKGTVEEKEKSSQKGFYPAKKKEILRDRQKRKENHPREGGVPSRSLKKGIPA